MTIDSKADPEKSLSYSWIVIDAHEILPLVSGCGGCLLGAE